MKFKFISDPGHGWVEVPMQLIELLGIKSKISAFSYRRGDMAYLEEDCDAGEFRQACEREGITIDYQHQHQDPTPIRHYSRFTA